MGAKVDSLAAAARRFARAAVAGAACLGIAAPLVIGVWPAVAAGPATPEAGDEQCRVCHGSPDIVSAAPGGRSLYVPESMVAASVHSSLACQDCHGELQASIHSAPAIELERARRSCVGCHSGPWTEYAAGSHGPSAGLPGGAARVLGDAPAATGAGPSVRPTCVGCHGAHEVAPAESRSFAAAMASMCSTCHTERGESFFDRDYHGKETLLGRFDVAVCSDCHGAHLVLPASDPRSRVNPANVLTTCRACHRWAPPNFADILVHVGGRPLPADPKLRLVTLWMTLLLVGTFGFFGLHTVLAARHAWRERRGVGT